MVAKKAVAKKAASRKQPATRERAAANIAAAPAGQSTPDPPKLEPTRAGGFIDRHDGEGWVLDGEHKPKPQPPPPQREVVPTGPRKVGGWVLTTDDLPKEK